MLKLIIVSAFVVCCIAAPTSNGSDKQQNEVLLQRPTPINPEVPSAPKPAEKITKITDPKEIAKYKREINPNTLKAFLPTITPDSPTKSASAHQPEPETKATNSVEATKAHREKRNIVDVSSSTLASVPLIYHDQAHQALQAEQSTKDKTTEHQTTDAHALNAPTPSASTTNEHNSARKRDIPVPLTPKHQHDETVEHSKNEDETKPKADNVETGVHSTAIAHEVSSTPTSTEHNSAKRDIPVPLVPKHNQDENVDHDHTKKSNEPKTDDIQVEDLNEHHSNKKREENTSTTNGSTDHSTHSTPIAVPLHSSAEHPAIIKHPIPVAELFAQHPTQ